MSFQISWFLPHGSGGFHQEGTDGFAADRSSFIITEEWLAFFDAPLVSIWKANKNVAGSLDGAKIQPCSKMVPRFATVVNVSLGSPDMQGDLGGGLQVMQLARFAVAAEDHIFALQTLALIRVAHVKVL